MKRLVSALLLLLLWAIVGPTVFSQGLDLEHDGLLLYGAALERSGQPVHAQLDTGDGPLRYQALGLWMTVFGESARSAATWEAARQGLGVTGCVFLVWPWAGLLGAALVTVVGLATPPAPLGLLLLIATVLLERKARDGNRWTRRGLGGLLALTLIASPLWFLTLLAILLLGPKAERGPLFRRELSLGAAALLVAAFAVTIVRGHAGPALENTLVAPWNGIFARAFGGGFGALRVLQDGAWLHLPFAGLETGERLGSAWAGHALSRAWSLRLAAVLPLALLVASFVPRAVAADRRRDGRAFAAGALVLTILGADIPSVQTGLALTAVGTLALPWTRPVLRLPALGLIVLVALPLAAETAWLATHARRDTLTSWEGVRAGIRLAPQRAQGLDAMMRALHSLHGRGIVIWPANAGIHFLLATSPARPSLAVPTKLNDAEWAALLGSPSPPPVLLGPSQATLMQNLRKNAPETARVLRRRYGVQGVVLAGDGDYRVLGPIPAEGGPSPLATRLPRIELLDANDATPALRDDLAIGQSFDVGDEDLRGLAARFLTSADSVPVKLRIRVWQRRGDRFDALLAAQNVEIVARREQPLHWFEVPVVETAGLHLAITFEALEAPPQEVRMAWHDHDGPGHGRDLFEEGAALLDLEPVPADLVLLVY